jgi:ParB family chromosome partitioning protein
MGTTQNTLDSLSTHIDESMGVRMRPTRVALSPVASVKDIGRRPLRGFGKVEIGQVVSDPDQPRSDFDAESLAQLGADMHLRGQLHPIHVRWSDELQKWVIITGERRWRAAQQVGLNWVDCFFHEEPLTRAQVLELQLVENLLREDLKPIEEAHAFRDLMALNEWNAKQVAESLRIPASKVCRSLALLNLPLDIQQQVEDGQVPARTAYELSKLNDDSKRRRLAQEAAAGKLTHDQAASVARRGRTQKPQSPVSLKRSFYAENGWTVTVSSRKSGTYHDVEQAMLEALDEVRLRLNNNVRL